MHNIHIEKKGEVLTTMVSPDRDECIIDHLRFHNEGNESTSEKPRNIKS